MLLHEANSRRYRNLSAISLSVSLLLTVGSAWTQKVNNYTWITQGPMLGRPGPTQMGVWARTSRPAGFKVLYGLSPDRLTMQSGVISTRLENDNTGWILIEGLKPATRYYYILALAEDGLPASLPGSFRTLPDPESFRHPQLNPNGLYNFSFEFHCGNNQSPNGSGPTTPGYRTMTDRISHEIDFALLNGDWIYEDRRDYPIESWMAIQGLQRAQLPRAAAIAPSIAGVWENYKVYLDRAKNLAEWHRNVPSYYTLDDHEIMGGYAGGEEIGYRNKTAVFRDVGTKAWFDYLGWSNPVTFPAEIQFGMGRLETGSDVLSDPSADFTKVDMGLLPTLNVHWGTPTAGLRDVKDEPDPNAGVYRLVEVLDRNRVRIQPAARATRTSAYSVGRPTYTSLRVANVDLFLLDCRSRRSLHDALNPGKPGISMLGQHQKAWLKQAMLKSNADFLLVASSVNFMIPHGSASNPAKDDAWTSFLEEREEMIRFWDSLGKPVILLTGDLHLSYTLKITDRIWEVASGPLNSANHNASDAGNMPFNGEYDSRGRRCDIRWSSLVAENESAEARRRSFYTVMQVNNVTNSPVEEGKPRWVRWPRPHLVIRHYDGRTGDLLYAEAVHAER